ncbi:MAG: imidazolonepropionase, partial [Flavihumibacter sp.]
MTTLYTNIGCLAGIGSFDAPLRGAGLATLNHISNGWLLTEGGHIAAFGDAATMPAQKPANVVDVNGGTLLPAWCDSHTHLVFGASREQEFVDKIRGLSYAGIAAKGGGN